jgi:multiple sugar transport system permease protein
MPRPLNPSSRVRIGMPIKDILFDPRLLLILAVAVGLWLLYPPRQLKVEPDEADRIEITYTGPGGEYATAMAEVIRAFENKTKLEHQKDPTKPWYRVVTGQTAAKDQTADPTRFIVSVAGGSPPDVIMFDRFAISEWASRGVFEPLDDYLSKDTAAHHPDEIKPDSFYKACWDEGRYNNRQYGIPHTTDDRALYYNKDQLIRAGLVDEKGQAKPPKDWDELREYAKKLTERDANGRITRIGFAPNYGNSWLYLFGFLNDAHFLSPDGMQCTLADGKVVDALTYMKAVYDDAGGYEAVQAFAAGFQSNALDPFIQGKVAMKIDGGFSLVQIAQYGRDLNFGIAPAPRPKELVKDGPVTWSGGWAFAIPSNSQKKQAAWEFLRFAVSDFSVRVQMESARELAEAEGRVFMPGQFPRPSTNKYSFDTYIAGNKEMPQKFKDARQVFDDLLPHARFRPVTPVGQLLWNEQINSMESALYHQQTPIEALKSSQTLVQSALDSVLSPPKGTPVTSWSWFFVGYAVLVVLSVLGVVVWHRWKHGQASKLHRQSFAGVFCASPWIIGFIIFGGGPMLFSLLMSFCDYDILNPPRLIGMDNYRTIYGGDRILPIAMWNTVYMMIGVPLNMALSLGLAILLNQKVRGMAAWRTLFYLPSVVPMVVVSVLWVWVLNPQGGLINLVLEKLGIPGPLWLQSAQWSKPSILLMGLWAAGSGMIVWLAGLNGIPQSLYEAASIDGASKWRQFWSVTLPQLTPYIFFNMLMGIIGTFQIFGQAFIMTAGGPQNSTLFYVYHLFNYAFRYGRMGYASAMAWVLFIIVLGLTIVQLRLSKRWVHYGDQA